MQTREEHNKYNREWAKKNPIKRLASFRRWKKKRKIWFDQIKSKLSCKMCGENYPACLDFHHINLKDKTGLVSRMFQRYMNKKLILKEIDKCEILCSNCHRKHHYK